MSSGEPRILKAKDLRGVGATIAFNFEDVRRRCDEHVEKVRGETRQMIEAAHAEAGLGRLSQAAGRLDALLAMHEVNQGPITLGSLHQARARVARLSHDQATFDNAE
jgi:hypothetical protein